MTSNRDNAFENARDLLQRTTELLTDCMTHAEAALENQDVRELIEALHQISSEARGIAADSQETGEQLASIHTLRNRRSA